MGRSLSLVWMKGWKGVIDVVIVQNFDGCSIFIETERQCIQSQSCTLEQLPLYRLEES